MPETHRYMHTHALYDLTHIVQSFTVCIFICMYKYFSQCTSETFYQFNYNHIMVSYPDGKNILKT